MYSAFPDCFVLVPCPRNNEKARCRNTSTSLRGTKQSILILLDCFVLVPRPRKNEKARCRNTSTSLRGTKQSILILLDCFVLVPRPRNDALILASPSLRGTKQSILIITLDCFAVARNDGKASHGRALPSFLAAPSGKAERRGHNPKQSRKNTINQTHIFLININSNKYLALDFFNPIFVPLIVKISNKYSLFKQILYLL